MLSKDGEVVGCDVCGARWRNPQRSRYPDKGEVPAEDQRVVAEFIGRHALAYL